MKSAGADIIGINKSTLISNTPTYADYSTNTNDKYGSTPSSPTQAATSAQASENQAEPS
jgi:hypothetical protein